MCILFAYLDPVPKPGGFKVIIATNRDEMYKRPAQPAHEWLNHQGVYGGLDMQPGKEGGTWLAVNQHGRIGALLNIGQKKELSNVDPASARGFFVTEWVTKMELSMTETFEVVKNKHQNMKPSFRLFAVDTNGDPSIGLLTFNGGNDENSEFEVEYLLPGYHALGNNAPGVSWKKVVEGKDMFENLVQEAGSWNDKQQLLSNLIEMLTSKNKNWPDYGMAEQMEGRPEMFLESLSSIFVEIPKLYGTRTQSVILISAENEALFYERTLEMPGESSKIWLENCHEFKLQV